MKSFFGPNLWGQYATRAYLSDLKPYEIQIITYWLNGTVFEWTEASEG